MPPRITCAPTSRLTPCSGETTQDFYYADCLNLTLWFEEISHERAVFCYADVPRWGLLNISNLISDEALREKTFAVDPDLEDGYANLPGRLFPVHFEMLGRMSALASTCC